jgi:hypothetical protein
MSVDETIKNLKLRHFGLSHFATGAEAADYLAKALAGQTVGIGGSKTIDQIGLYDKLDSEKTFWHWKVPGEATYAAAATADAYITGANAISEDGQILNIDGHGNRLSAQLFGHKKVYVVAGVNKICPDFDSALYRARNTAAVTNIKRFPANTPCKVDGKCHDCRSAERLCNGLVVLWGPMTGMETEVVLIDEELGM